MRIATASLCSSGFLIVLCSCVSTPQVRPQPIVQQYRRSIEFKIGSGFDEGNHTLLGPGKLMYYPGETVHFTCEAFGCQNEPLSFMFVDLFSGETTTCAQMVIPAEAGPGFLYHQSIMLNPSIREERRLLMKLTVGQDIRDINFRVIPRP